MTYACVHESEVHDEQRLVASVHGFACISAHSAQVTIFCFVLSQDLYNENNYAWKDGLHFGRILFSEGHVSE